MEVVEPVVRLVVGVAAVGPVVQAEAIPVQLCLATHLRRVLGEEVGLLQAGGLLVWDHTPLLEQ